MIHEPRIMNHEPGAGTRNTERRHSKIVEADSNAIGLISQVVEPDPDLIGLISTGFQHGTRERGTHKSLRPIQMRLVWPTMMSKIDTKTAMSPASRT